MSTHAHRPPSARLAVGARVFGLVVLSAPALWSRDDTGVLALVAVGAIWLASSVAEALRVNSTVVSLLEASLIGTVAALTIGSSLAVLGALAIPPFTASLRHGPRGMLLALSAELIPLVTLSAVLHGGMLVEQGVSTFTWVVTGIGLGLIGSFLRSSLYAANDPLTPYRDAQALLRELIDLSGRLGSGLDPISLGATIAERVRDQLPVSSLAVHVPRGHDLSPLTIEPGGSPESLTTLHVLALETCRTGRTARDGNAFAFPLMTDVGLVAVVSASLTDGLHPDAVRLEHRLNDLSKQLEPNAVHLDTAVLFGYFRDAATTDERRRLAREMHDGVAQEIASIGYLVDGIAAQAATAAETAQLGILRERITGVVAEVRRSVQSLRTEVGASDSLGSAIGGLARHLSDSSGIQIRVSADERTTRLRTDVEAELLRIAQEAMTNAVRHSGASSIVVHCRVDAPAAEIMVQDDGSGLGPRRSDSHGLEIMHERARLVGAELTIVDCLPHGTVVTVRLPGTNASQRDDLLDDTWVRA
jgi:signal transduction histidine kinase